MKNLLLTVATLAAACALSFALFFRMNDDDALHRAARDGDAMTWLKVEFQLNDAQFAAVEKLHDDYTLVCAKHCAAIVAARRRSAPATEVAALEKTCVDAMSEHFRRVAGLMPHDQGERYLATVLPRVAAYDHAHAPNVQVKP